MDWDNPIKWCLQVGNLGGRNSQKPTLISLIAHVKSSVMIEAIQNNCRWYVV